MAKFNVKAACQNIAVQPLDRHLLGMDHYFVDFLWAPVSALYFQFSRIPGGVGSREFLRDSRPFCIT